MLEDAIYVVALVFAGCIGTVLVYGGLYSLYRWIFSEPKLRKEYEYRK